jgi:type IV secretory pathway component VirB8
MFNMDLETLSKEVREQREIINSIYTSVEKTRKYFLWTMIITVAVVVLPLIAMVFVIPSFISTYSSLIDGSALGI